MIVLMIGSCSFIYIYNSKQISLMANKIPVDSLSTTGLADEAAATKDTKNNILFIAKSSSAILTINE